MSNNITNWKTKTLKDVIIPLSAWTKHPREDWHPEVRQKSDGKVIIDPPAEYQIHGKMIDDNRMELTFIDFHGESSGTFYEWIFKTALREASGELEAVMIFESGEVYRLEFKDGEITEDEVEL